MRLTLDTLKTIEKMDNQVPRKANKVAGSGDGRKGKRKVDSKDDKNPKKRKRSCRHCALCANHGGAKSTHNTVDCRRYKKDRTPKKTFKSQKGKFPVNNKIDGQSFKTMEDNIQKVKSDLRKIKEILLTNQRNANATI